MNAWSASDLRRFLWLHDAIEWASYQKGRAIHCVSHFRWSC